MLGVVFERESETLYDSRSFKGDEDSPSNLTALDCDAEDCRTPREACERQGCKALESGSG